MNKKYKKQFEFSGGYFHRGLFPLLRDDKITKTDLLLLFVVDSFVKYGKRGCTTSNEYLAEATGTTLKYISEIISKLAAKNLKLLKITRTNGVRYLETDWSRFTIEKEQMEKEQMEKEALRKNPDPPLRKNPDPLRKNPDPPPEKSGSPSGKIRSIIDKKKNNTNKRREHAPVSEPLKDFQLGELPKSKAQQLTSYIYKKFQESGKLERNPTKGHLSNWSKEFSILIEQGHAYEEIKQAIDIHVLKLGEEFWPECYAGSSFCKNYARIRRAINRKGLNINSPCSEGKGSDQPIIELTKDGMICRLKENHS